MTVQIGPYAFDNVEYDREHDVLYLAIGDPHRAVEWDVTAEEDAIAFDEHGQLMLLTIIGPKAREAEAGGLRVSLSLRPNLAPALA